MMEHPCESSRIVDLENNNRSTVTDWVNIVVADQTRYSDSTIHEGMQGSEGGNHFASNTQTHEKRKIEKVPLLLRVDGRNKLDYEPLVISLGPYHYKRQELQLAEKFKQTALQMYVSDSGKNIDVFKQKIQEVIHFARSCYVEGSTDAYDDEEFAQMLLHDGCFILSNIEFLSFNPLHSRERFLKVMLEHLGRIRVENITRDILLLENQLPYQVLQVLISVKFSEDEWEEILNAFLNYIHSGGRFPGEQFTVKRKPIPPFHLLDIYRTYIISPPSSFSEFLSRLTNKIQLGDQNKKIVDVRFKQLFRSVTELKAKGIQVRPSSSKSMVDIKFKSYNLYGQLEIPSMIILSRTKTMFLNLIAYEMCPNNPNDFGITNYIMFLKSVILHPDDVKELRSKHILVNFLGTYEDVVKMFEEMILPTESFNLWEVKESIEGYCNSKAKTWIAEFFSRYFSGPWTVIASVAATFLLSLIVLQTYFTVSPRSYK